MVSDCGAITDIYTNHKFTSSLVEAAAAALKAGVDLDCGSAYAVPNLQLAIEKKLISVSDIDKSLKRTLAARFKLGFITFFSNQN